MNPNKTKGKKRKGDRGFYKPKSYRFSEEVHKEISLLAKEFGSQNLAIKELINNYKKNGKQRNKI